MDNVFSFLSYLSIDLNIRRLELADQFSEDWLDSMYVKGIKVILLSGVHCITKIKGQIYFMGQIHIILPNFPKYLT